MADDITNDSDQLELQNKQSEAEKRIKQLSEKVRLTAEEGAEKDKLLKESNEKIANLEKENTFSTGFADILGNYPAAKDHKDDIKAKVMGGSTVEDAMFAVLGKAGKLGSSTPPPQVAGGSATTTVTQATKEVKDMNLAEKREILAKELIWQ